MTEEPRNPSRPLVAGSRFYLAGKPYGFAQRIASAFVSAQTPHAGVTERPSEPNSGQPKGRS